MRIQKNRLGIDIRTAKRKSNLIPIQKLCRILRVLASSKKIKKKTIRKKKNTVHDNANTLKIYFNLREIFPIFFNKKFM